MAAKQSRPKAAEAAAPADAQAAPETPTGPNHSDLADAIGRLGTRLDSIEQRTGAVEQRPDLQLEIERLRTQLAEATGRLSALETGVGELKLSVPRVEKTLTTAEVRRRIADDPGCEFRVTEDFKHFGQRIYRNSRVRATDRPDLPDMVQAGLLLTPSEGVAA